MSTPLLSGISALFLGGTQIYYRAISEGPYELDGLVGRQVPDTEVYAPRRVHIREAEAPPSSTTFVKYSYYSVVMKELDSDPNLFSQVYAEIDVLEQISKTAHRNIVEYRGCLRRDDLIVGICLRRYPCSLKDLALGAVAEDVHPPYDPEVILADVQCGLNFLHNLGLVHDDITPRNIMVDENGRTIILDFDCCRPIGSKSRGGTPGWATKPAVSLIENDEYGLRILKEWSYVSGVFESVDHSSPPTYRGIQVTLLRIYCENDNCLPAGGKSQEEQEEHPASGAVLETDDHTQSQSSGASVQWFWRS
ncbi:hypothetical protein D9619_007005 [Psilocybe cf. subviscida]|uniref:Protein kinase domain-containing protein n=1 Tax=Psilocybe cf. subviscida TaxID=2480587 RepID=A0A8H5EX07_9AGAR|nr:hypothetical protein D9619_007005 [Psilocybe cf. subviscida]